MLGKTRHYPQLQAGPPGTHMTTGLGAFVSGLAGQGLPSLTELGMGTIFSISLTPFGMEELMQMLRISRTRAAGSLHPHMLFADWITKLQYLNIVIISVCITTVGSFAWVGGTAEVCNIWTCGRAEQYLSCAPRGGLDCQALRLLKMVNCKWQEDFNDGLGAVMRALDTCSRLTELDFSWVAIMGTALAAAGQFGGSLRVLKLKRTLLNNECVRYLTPIVDGCAALEELDLACNCFDDQGLLAMVQALSRPCSVRVLGLSGTKIRNNGLVSLVQAQALWPNLSRSR